VLGWYHRFLQSRLEIARRLACAGSTCRVRLF
jgi:hypothetical protein